MLCYDVSLDGERLCIAGSKDFVLLDASLLRLRQNPLPHIQVYGTIRTGEKLIEDAIWARREVKPNQEIRIRLVELDAPDEPEKLLKYGTASNSRGQKEPHCSFCSQDEATVGRIFEGPGGNICQGCVTSFAAQI